MNLRNLAVAALLAATATAAQQPFQLDPGFHFDPQGIAVGDVLERPDGKIIVSGIMQYPSWDIQCSGLLLEPNGSIIPSPSDIPALDWYFYMGGKMVPWGDQFYVQNSHTIQRLWMDGGWDSAFMAHMQPMSGGGVGGDYHVFPDGRLLEGISKIPEAV